MATPETIEIEQDRYVGYLNDVDLFIEAMYDEKRNPNGIGKIKLCVDSSALAGVMSGGMGEFYREIFGMNNYYSEGYNVSSSYQSASNPNNNFFNWAAGGNNITKTIKFIINDDIAINGGNDWESAIDNLTNTFNKVNSAMSDDSGSSWISKQLGKLLPGINMQKFGKGAKAALAVGNSATAMMGVRFQTLMQTIKFWKGSHEPTFPLRFNMLATRPDMDIRKDLLALYASVYPVSITDVYNTASAKIAKKYEGLGAGASKMFGGQFLSGLVEAINNFASLTNPISAILSGGEAALSGFMSAPLGYNPVDGYKSSLYPTTEDGSGLIDLKIGKWLHIPNLLMKNFNAKMSKVTTRFGYPLYANCTLELQPVRMWTITDIYSSFYSNVDAAGNRESITYNKGRLDDGKITKVKIGQMP